MRDTYIEEADIAWMNSAACIGMDIDLFFPSDGVNLSSNVKAVCSGCPVKMDCYIYAEKNHLDYGAFGGMSARERHETRRVRGRGSYQFKRITT